MGSRSGGDENVRINPGVAVGLEVTSSRDLPLALSFPRYRGSRPVRRPINHPLTDIPIDKRTGRDLSIRFGAAEIAKI